MSARTSADGDDRSSACSTRPGRPQSSASACGQDVPARVLRSAARRPRPGSRSPRHGSGSGCAADGATYLIVSTAPKAARTANHSVRSHAAGSTAGPATPRPGPSQPGRRALGGRGLLHAGPGGPVPQGQVDHALEVGGGRGTSRSPARETGSPRAVGRPTRSRVTTRPRAIQKGRRDHRRRLRVRHDVPAYAVLRPVHRLGVARAGAKGDSRHPGEWYTSHASRPRPERWRR